MRRMKMRDRRRLHLGIWTLIIVGSIFLLLRLVALSFSNDVGQAKRSIGSVIMSGLCINVFESGSSLLNYVTEKEETAYKFPVNLLSDEFALQKYMKESNSYAVLLQNSNPFVIQGIHNRKEEKVNNKISFYNISTNQLTKDYILSNGAMFHRNDSYGNIDFQFAKNSSGNFTSNELPIGVIGGEFYFEETEDKETNGEGSAIDTMHTNGRVSFTLDQLKDTAFFVRNFYIIDQSTKITEGLFDAEKLLSKDMTLKQENNAPQILIYHTHSQEAFVDSRKNVKADSVVGIGSYLTDILENEYGYNVIHDTSCYDVVDGKLDRNFAYNLAKDGIEKLLKKHPSIEVVIDLHRDGVAKRSTIIDGKETAQIMLLNGLSRDQNGPITHLDNPYLSDNLAFSLQLQMKSLELYPGLFYKNYLQCYRYNMHVRPKCILMELGTHENTLQSAKNAMEPFAEILDAVLQGK
ncbi:stage II sporulation protein P [Mobilitalea sibirica]|uniref:Stage II sporulation protein P n=1 Tax=Mobilitalea sibirica TaxID=1462919 RepID=A0A8J7KWJ7_9FIRM|nr:stage II sporulation protein P [Mobilitalea sibirica]MBH1941425.1 stage II sporulation protein P [Mobilitalea sibirica]